MSQRPYHHGDLRATLLAHAEETLRHSGADALSLRELARRAGVSHAAPHRHFPDKAALLEALVSDGLTRLRVALADAARPGRRGFDRRIHAVATAYVRFATANPALTELMSTNRYLAGASGDLAVAREDSFAPVVELIAGGQACGALAPGDPRTIATTFFALLHGIATLANNEMVDPFGHRYLGDAVDALLDGIGSRSRGTRGHP